MIVGMSATDIAIIIAAGANAAGVIIGLGQLRQSLADVRDDIREMRASLQAFLQAMALKQPPSHEGKH
jgi:hypothetical protein